MGRLAVTSDPREIVAALTATRDKPVRSEAGGRRAGRLRALGDGHGLPALTVSTPGRRRPSSSLAKSFAAEVLVRHGAEDGQRQEPRRPPPAGRQKRRPGDDLGRGAGCRRRARGAKAADRGGRGGGGLPRRPHPRLAAAAPSRWRATVPGLAASPGLAIGPLRLLCQTADRRRADRQGPRRGSANGCARRSPRRGRSSRSSTGR